MLAPSKRQMHLGVFWIGAGNHSAGWRYDGAWVSNSSWPVVAAGAQIAERGKFDLFFIADSLAMDPGDLPSFITRFEPTTLISALSTVTLPAASTCSIRIVPSAATVTDCSVLRKSPSSIVTTRERESGDQAPAESMKRSDS